MTERTAMITARQWRIVLVARLGILSLAWLGSARDGGAVDLAAGEKLYDTLCVRCHGQDGRSDGPVAKA